MKKRSVFAGCKKWRSGTLRTGRMVRNQKSFGADDGDSMYYICPKCGILLEREFMSYCDHCGQKLNWHRVTIKLSKLEKSDNLLLNVIK